METVMYDILDGVLNRKTEDTTAELEECTQQNFSISEIEAWG